MIKIRLTRHGKKNSPYYRIVVIDKNKKRGGEPLEVLGHWFPEKKDFTIDKIKVEDWKKKGAKVSEAVKKLLK
jgi:small subunit ribosomal protein S16